MRIVGVVAESGVFCHAAAAAADAHVRGNIGSDISAIAIQAKNINV